MRQYYASDKKKREEKKRRKKEEKRQKQLARTAAKDSEGNPPAEGSAPVVESPGDESANKNE